MDMEIVDSHVHFWSLETHPWLTSKNLFPAESFTVPEYNKELLGYNVTQCVHVEAAWPGDPVGETKWLSGIADRNPAGFPNAIVGHADLFSSNLEEVLRRHCEYSRFRGIRPMRLKFDPKAKKFNLAAQQDCLTDPEWVKSLGLLEKYNLSLELIIPPQQMIKAAAVVKQYPNLMVMLEHCGLPHQRDEASMKLWKEGLEELAKCPNVYCKVSGVFMADQSCDVRTFMETCGRPCLEIFGVNRCVFASNFPVDKSKATFSELVIGLETVLHPYSLEDKRKFFAENAKRFYRL